MEFGRLASIEGVDFRLPDDDARNSALLATARAGEPEPPRLRIGLAGWSDRGFLGTLYPRAAKGRDFLVHHTRALTASELNTTYYGFERERIARWSSAAPASFRFCPTLPSEVTHERRLHDVDVVMARYLDALHRACRPQHRAR